MSNHHASNAVGDFVMLAAFVSCWTSAGWSGRRAAKELRRKTATRSRSGRQIDVSAVAVQLHKEG